MIIKDRVLATWNFIKADHQEWPFRFWMEVLIWLLSIACSMIMMLTVPDPPFLILYPMWIAVCIIYGWAAWTRGSFGMLANYLLLTSVHVAALIRLWP